MTQYVIVYLGGDQPSSQEEGKQHMAKYMEWLSALGDSAVSPANPLKNTSTVNSDGTVTTGGTTSMSGYTKLVWILWMRRCRLQRTVLSLILVVRLKSQK